jgi:hypothetical protein
MVAGNSFQDKVLLAIVAISAPGKPFDKALLVQTGL